MASDIKISGMKEVLKAIDATPAKILAALKPVVTKHTAALEGKARQNAPVADGELSGSIKSQVVEGDGYVFGRVTASAPHAIHVEYGTVATRAQPFLRPALQQDKASFQADAAAAIKAL
jgi:HK97 gp10 family phage protein